jgi:prepilin-type N-terminal cleavage/methylation domain-containing protein
VRRIFKNTDLQKGFTLIEMVVSMGLFIIIMVIASQAFNKIISQSSRISKMEESNIEGVIGLEVMRHDLVQMGFGLPWSWKYRITSGSPTAFAHLTSSGLKYAEATDSKGLSLNDAPNNVPRAFVAYAKLGQFSSAFISVKGTAVGRVKASQRWTYIPFLNYSAATWESRPVAFASNNPQVGNMVLMVNSDINNPALDHALIVEPGSSATSGTISSFSVAFKNSGMVDDYLPTNQNQTYMVYGLLDANTPSDPRMPFNRTDFFIGQNLSSNIVPPFCAERTGVLYKAAVNHGSSTGGAYNYIPLLDCVADMQVVLGWNSNLLTATGTSEIIQKASSVNAYSSLSDVAGGAVTASPAAAAGDIASWLLAPKTLREQLKIIKVYILAQEGKRDANYNGPATIDVGDLTANGFKKTYTFTTEQKKFRWKVYRIVVTPKNLISNSY